MRQTAVFVDAGYLFAAGTALITGSKKARKDCILDVHRVLQDIAAKALAVEPAARLLRTYWYDGVRPYSGPSAEQMALGQEPFVKLRLGMLNSQGEQKGVDSLIVTDLIDLARNGAIHDALILAGDEDLRVGVQVAQSLGVRVHLLGVAPTRGNVSPHLRQEVDSVAELDAETVKNFLSCRGCAEGAGPGKRLPVDPPAIAADDITRALESAIASVLRRFDAEQIRQHSVALEATGSLPREIDAPILGQARHELARDLTIDEKRLARTMARDQLKQV